MTALSDQISASVQGLSTNHPSGVTLGRQRQAQAQQEPWQVYIHERGKRPRRLEMDIPDKFPGTIKVDGCTYYWVSADISQRTLTYSNFKAGS